MLFGAAALGACASMNAGEVRRPIVIAHRGASGERPEHTMGAYRLAIAQGADFIEPDLVLTRDGVLVCRHENEISGTTDVATHAAFAARRTTKTIDGQSVSGWFVEDFTLEELRTLRCKERLPELRPRNMEWDGEEEIPVFTDVLALAMASGVGIYPELKHPGFLAAQGLDPVGALIGAFARGGGQAAVDRAFVQCFEIGPLITLASMSSIRWNCIQLIAAEGGPADRPSLTYADMVSDAGLAEIAVYARGIGVEKRLIIPRGADETSLPPTDLVARAHAARLLVHAWTFRAENYFLPSELRRSDPLARTFMRLHGDLAEELRRFYAQGVDGVFCDFPAMAVCCGPGVSTALHRFPDARSVVRNP